MQIHLDEHLDRLEHKHKRATQDKGIFIPKLPRYIPHTINLHVICSLGREQKKKKMHGVIIKLSVFGLSKKRREADRQI